ncbi:CBS domain-containing protein [Leptospira idonii]|uniref:CBS domain-containing protein n=1 Tax=Leptospira idonii TaxID=1193500 RepID=A0A4R9M7M6_9LEPT|nr:CBS domain-containing protein [Leptospira idonii]TGN20608.1 CBS domain-containing protein [Leptospira idonii]
MFFWIQNGISTQRLPEPRPVQVPRIENSSSVQIAPRFKEGEEQIPTEGNRADSRPGTLFGSQSPAKAYQDSNYSPEPSPILFAGQVMSSPVQSLSETCNLKDARDFLLEKRFRHIPITNLESQITGIISDRDIWRYLSESENGLSVPISSLMVKKILTGTQNTEIRTVAKVMLEEKIGSLPILGENRILIGILTRSDLIRAMVRFPGFTLLA